jgi:HPr kinase/phosphorylase
MMKPSADETQKNTDVTVEYLYNKLAERLEIELLNGDDGLPRTIAGPDLYITGLALAGFVDSFPGERIQIMGTPEVQYIESLDVETLRVRLRTLTAYPIPCIIVTNNHTLVPAALETADEAGICVFRVPYGSTYLFHAITSILNPLFAPTASVHGTLVDVYGMGLMFTGRSGIGKSEIALDLIERGHRLVADDIVVLKRLREHSIVGAGLPDANHHMEVRGLGILNIPKMFGIRSIRENKRIEVEVRLEDRKELTEFDRTGLNPTTSEYLGVKIPMVNLPIFAGKNITVIAETIALNNILKMHGYDAASEFNKQLMERMNKDTSS